MAKKLRLKLGLPDVIESFLIGGVFLLLFLFDILQNKFIDLGLDYEVTVYSGLSFPAINGFWIAVVFYHLFLFALIIRSAWDRGTHRYYDYVVGALVVLGMYFIVIGAITGIYFSGNDPIPWLFNITQINAYHTGIFLQVFGALYFLMTK